MGDETLLGGGDGGYQKVPEDHGGVAVARVLHAAGVRRLFCLPGGHIGPVTNGCAEVGIEVITTRHESAAIHMAEAWARTTGEVGVAAVTAGPGFTNGVTGLANAQATGIPVVVLGGRTPLGLRGKGAVQDADQESIARAVAKWTRAVTRPEDLASATREALSVARSGRPGSAYLELPTDVLTAQAPFTEGEVARPQPAGADEDAVSAAADALARSERPVVVAGGGAFWARAGDALSRFVETSGIPVTTTSHARGLVADSHPHSLGSLLHGGVATAFADVVLIVGSRFNGNLMFGREPLWRPDHTIISVDVDPAAFALNRSPDIALLGDARVVLAQLTGAWGGDPKQEWCDQARSFADASRQHWSGEADGNASGVHPGALAREVCAFAADAGPGSTIVLDGGDILGWGLGFARCEEPGSQLFTSDALGTLGVGVPYAVAAPLARRDGPTVALLGDGAFGLAAMELETAARYGTAPIVVVSNNGSWGDVRYEEGEWFGRTVGTDLGRVRHDRIAEAVGGHGERVERAEDLRPALDRARDAGVVAIIDVLTDPDRPNEVLRNMGALDLQ
ncbi:MAG: thiamine pyrophosphate-binding protein [Actinobacteria bacterium]|nr:thiamine pyrophosphate-binding protein [Actinomycetota bacterium]